MSLADQTAIVGVGYTEYSKNSGVSTLELALRAIRSAVEDAGLDRRLIDGVACHRVGDSANAIHAAHALGIDDLRFHLDLFGGGSVSAGVVGAAAAAVHAGQADYVVCWRAVNARSEFRMGGTGRAAPIGGEFQYQLPYGLFTPPQQFAVYCRPYLERFGVEPEDLGRVAIAQRDFALRSPRAMMKTPLSMSDYLASRFVAEPLRLYDCCLETDAAVALIVTTTERARDLRQVPVLIAGATYGGGHTLYSNRKHDFTTTGATAMSKRLYEMAGVRPADVDVALLYDAFTPLVLMQLEAYGFCKPGEAAAFVAAGETVLGGSLPVNTHGGHLSEGYVHGINHVAEGVQQLRHACGERQVPDATLALSTGQPGYVAGTTSALLLRRSA